VRKLVLLITLGAVALLALAATASATSPETYGLSETGSDPHAMQCDGFEISGVFSTSVEGTAFFDQADQVIRVLARVRAQDTVTNSVTGKTLVNRGVFQGSRARAFTRACFASQGE